MISSPITPPAVRSLCSVVALVCVLQTGAHAEQVASTSASPRVISLAPTVTKEIYLLDAAQHLAGITTYCPQPATGPEIESVGALLEPNVEKIALLKPDIVFATSMTNVRRIKTLRALGIEVELFPEAKDFDQICAQFMVLGRRLDKEQLAASIVKTARSRTEALKTRVSARRRPTVFLQIGAHPLVTVNRDSFLNDLIESAGGLNIARDVKIRTYSRESVLARDPEVIVVVSMGLSGEDQGATWKNLTALNAAKHHRIYVVDADRFCSPTPTGYVQALEKMVNILHPDVETNKTAQGSL